MAAQEDIFETLREQAAFSRDVEEQTFRGETLLADGCLLSTVLSCLTSWSRHVSRCESYLTRCRRQ